METGALRGARYVVLEAKPGFEPGVKALQASALPLGHFARNEKSRLKSALCKQWSGQRGSNPRPQPWQGCALPTEPCPLAMKYYTQNRRGVQGSISKNIRAGACAPHIWRHGVPRRVATGRSGSRLGAPCRNGPQRVASERNEAQRVAMRCNDLPRTMPTCVENSPHHVDLS